MRRGFLWLSRNARLTLVAALTGACLWSATGSAMAATTTYTVSGFGDSSSGSCTPSDVCSNLRSAVAVAEIHPPATVELDAGTYTLTQGELDIDVSDGGSTPALTISGAGSGQTIIDQTTTGSRVLDFSGGGPYAVEDLEITGGNATGSSLNGAIGGGIDAGTTSLQLSGVLITGNSVVGGVGQNGNSSSPGATGGDAYGGGLYAYGTDEQIDNSTISGNTATGGVGGGPGSGSPSNEVAGEGGEGIGGGLAVADAQISGTTISGNTATGGAGGSATSTTPGAGGYGEGGGLSAPYDELERVYVVNSTIAQNIAAPGSGGRNLLNESGAAGQSYGGGLEGEIDSDVEMFSDTLASNSALGATAYGGNISLFILNGRWTLADTVIGNGGAANEPNCEVEVESMGEIFDDGNNLVSDTTGDCELATNKSDIFGADPELGPLQDNGGPTATEMPQSGSPLLRAGGASCSYTLGSATLSALVADQRGQARSGPCDIGAVQVQGPAVSGAPSLTGSAAVGQPLTCHLSPASFTGDGQSYSYAWLRNGTAISGQSSAIYTVGSADAGQTIACSVTATGIVGSVSVHSTSELVAAAGTQANPSQPTSPSTPAIEVKSRRLLDAKRHTKLRLECVGGQAGCVGTVMLWSVNKRGKRKTRLVDAHYSIRSNTSATVTLKLAGATRPLLRAGHGHFKATLHVTIDAGAEVSAGVTVT